MAKYELRRNSDRSQSLDAFERLLLIGGNKPERRSRNFGPKTLEKEGTRFVYAVSGGDSVKFGVSNCPIKRIKEIQVGCPYELRFEGYARFKTEDANVVEMSVFKVAEILNIPRRGEWLRGMAFDASVIFREACAISCKLPIEVFGFASAVGEKSGHTKLLEWSATGSFGRSKRRQRR